MEKSEKFTALVEDYLIRANLAQVISGAAFHNENVKKLFPNSTLCKVEVAPVSFRDAGVVDYDFIVIMNENFFDALEDKYGIPQRDLELERVLCGLSFDFEKSTLSYKKPDFVENYFFLKKHGHEAIEAHRLALTSLLEDN
jgi:hypothetical protein